MKDKMNRNLFQKFTLKLKSRTEGKRLSEAKLLLKDIYPYEVDERNIYIEKSEVKGLFDVYVSKEEINKDPKVKGLALLAAALLVLVTSSIFIIHHGISENENAALIQKEKEESEKQKIKEQKEKEERLVKVKNEYLEKTGACYEKVFPHIERIYSCIWGNTTIENIAIDKNGFSVEVTTRDAVKVLENFEKSSAFNSVKMNRTTVKKNMETVTYSGTFVRLIKDADELGELEEKIAFYENCLDNMKLREERIKALKLSEHIRTVRAVLREDGCTEEYIQLKGNGNATEIEFFIISSSSEILKFIKDIQKEPENLFDIKQIKIRNSEDRNRIQTTVCFDVKVTLDSDKNEITELSDEEFKISEIDKAFYKVSRVQSTGPRLYTAETGLKKAASETINESKIVAVKSLSYLGLTKSGNDTYVMAKDNAMGSIYKLKLNESGLEENTCNRNGSTYMAKIRGEYYEVR